VFGRNKRTKVIELASGKEKTNTLTKVILALLFGVFLVEVFLSWNITSTMSEKIRSGNLNLVEISDSACSECASASSLSSLIRNDNSTKIISSKTLDFSSAEAKSLIQQYGVQKIPAVIVTGEFKKDNVVFLWGQLNGRMLDNGVVLEVNPPYVNVSTGNKEGVVSLTTIVDSACTDCVSMDTFVSSMKQAGVYFSSQKTLEYTSTEAQSLILSQDIKRIPAIVFSKDIEAYPAVYQFLTQTNATQRQGFYAYHTSTPPYLNLSTGMINGRVSVVYLTDAACSSCYDVTQHRAILQNFGVKVVNESTYDVNSTTGGQLLSQYNITKVPTILLSPDAAYYVTLNQVWTSVGTVATDGWYIFRGTEQMGTYMDLSTGKAVTPGK